MILHINFFVYHISSFWKITKQMIYDMINSRKKIFWSCVDLFQTLAVIISLSFRAKNLD